MTRRIEPRLWTIASAILVLLAWGTRPASALLLGKDREMRLSGRAYTALRVGTQQMGGDDDPLSWPDSGAGHIRQHRYFLQLDFDHDLLKLAEHGYGVARLFDWLDLDAFSYSMSYRGEGEGIYDYGPSEFSDLHAKTRAVRLNFPNPDVVFPAPPAELLIRTRRKIPREMIRQRVSRLRDIARQRHRLFLAYVDLEKGPLFVRIGRQVLAWGDTDIFRLLDNINPLDDSFGGFFISLDERRLPIEMIRANWTFGSFGPFADVDLEGFAATGNRVATNPGIPPGSPWAPAGFGFPNPAVRPLLRLPDRTAIRGGGRLRFTAKDVTYQLAHYYTYLDVPGAQFKLPGVPTNIPNCSGGNTPKFCNPIVAFQRYPRVSVTGGSLSFPISRLYTIVRSEAAWIRGEPMNRQGVGNSHHSFFGFDFDGKPTRQLRRLRAAKNTEGGLNPFVYPRFVDPRRQNPLWGTVLQRDTFNMSIGFDVNRFIRWLNPHQSFFITTQFFYRHVFDSPGDLVLPVPVRNTRVGKRLPAVGVPNERNILGTGVGGGCQGGRRACKIQPRLGHLDDDRFLHTLLITTSYWSGRVVPALAMFYDWQGPVLVQPGVTYVRDPFRFIVDYTYIGGPTTGQIGLVRDRDNARFQVEFVF